jgi:hypothetical protein
VVNARSGRFNFRKEIQHPLYRRLGGPQGRSGRGRKILLPPGLDAWTVQPVASRYTDCTVPARTVALIHNNNNNNNNNNNDDDDNDNDDDDDDNNTNNNTNNNTVCPWID